MNQTASGPSTASHRRARRTITTALILALGAYGVPATAQAAVPAKPKPKHCPALGASDTNPDFGPNVTVFDPAQPVEQINAKLQSLSGFGEFSDDRHAVLFKPGTYGSAAGAADPSTATGIVNAEVGYYTTVAGLGANPGDVTINGALHVEPVQRSADAPWDAQGPGSLDRFWRSLSNMAINPIQRPVGADAERKFPEGIAEPQQMRWAASQASPLRRLDIKGSLTLFGRFGAYASGGFLADSRIDGKVVAGSQQQYYTRDSAVGSWEGAVWNMVFSGVQGAPAPTYPADGHNPQNVPPVTVLPTTKVSRGAPYITVGADGRYSVMSPKARFDAAGADRSVGTKIPLSQFFLARPSDSASKINSALKSGLNVIFTPGIYHLDEPVRVDRPNTIVLGLGMATLQPDTGKEAIVTGDVPGVQLSGFTVDAGPRRSKVLVQVGPRHAHKAQATNPTTLTDVFIRVGGRIAGATDVAMEVNTPNTLLDDTWIWRADHGNGVGWTTNPADTGLVVNGDDVTATGLFVEHFKKTETIWNGERGTTVFYQNEMPYDPPSAQEWSDKGKPGYAAYKVAPSIKKHDAYGLGVYSFFPNTDVTATQGIEVPNKPGVRLTHMVTRYLNGLGGIASIVNGVGLPVSKTPGQETSYLNSYGG